MIKRNGVEQEDLGGGLSTIETSGEKLIREGKTLVRTQVPYQTAIKVQVPRSLDDVIKAVERESQFAGDAFYYSWALKSGKSAGKKIEGGSVGLAVCLAREWKNVAVPVIVDETDDTWIFTASFIDIETGFNLQRIFRYRKDRITPGMYEPARAEDQAFQSAQSRAIRNVILTAMPKWLINNCIEIARQAEINKITKEGLAGAIEKAIKFFSGCGVTEEQLVDKMDKPKAHWTAEDVATLRGLAQAIKDGQVNVKDEFNTTSEPEDKEKGAISVGAVLQGEPKTDDKKSEPPPSLFEEGKKQKDEKTRQTLLATIKAYRKKIGDEKVNAILAELNADKEEDLDPANLNILYASCVAESKKK